jgi:hypothetical protein
MGTKFTHLSSLFQMFRLIPLSQHFALIRFFKQHEKEIEQLPTEEHITMLAYFVDALHQEGGQDTALIKNAEDLLQLSILHNLQFVDGEDIYLRTLYQKTIAHLRLNQLEKATKIARQLLHLAPHSRQYRQLLQECLLLNRPNWVKNCFGLGIFALAAAISFSVTNILFIESFYYNWLIISQLFEFSAYGLSVLFLLAGLFGHYYFVQMQVKKELIL